MERRRRVQRWLSLILPLILAGVLLVACDAIEARRGTLTDGEVDVDTDPNEYHLVYVDETALEEQPTFDRTILDEEGAILDDQAVADTETEIPSEFANLIQLSEYGDVDLNNAEGEDLGGSKTRSLTCRKAASSM